MSNTKLTTKRFVIRKSLLEIYSQSMNLVENVKVSENLKYHLDNNIIIYESLQRKHITEH